MLMGKVIEHSETGEMFLTPKNRETTYYIEGRYGEATRIYAHEYL